MSNPLFTSSIHLVFSSHWDREWYQPFEYYREKLVRMLDEVFAHLESGRLPCYQMDGQFIPVEDYLEIRPEKRALVQRLIASGNLRVGPWYVLPDEFLVSGESLIRNLQLGMQRAQAMGQTSRAGWLCDLFGHNNQMPQILRHVGLDHALLWRGVPFHLPGVIEWEGVDGTRVLVHRFPAHGYVDFPFAVPLCNDRGREPSIADMVNTAVAEVERYRQFYPSPVLLFFDGGDHLEFRPRMLEFVDAFNQRAGRAALRVSTLDDYITELKTRLPEPLTVHRGEMREPASLATQGWLIPGVGSSRIPLKRANHAGETLLTLWAEPWCGIASTQLGWEYPTQALELAWEYLLKNHPHDSICGCSTDETHAAMPYRFDQSRQIAEAYLRRAHEHLAGTELRGTVAEKELGLTLFTPVGGEPQPCPEVTVRLPVGWPQFQEFYSFESKPAFRVYDLAGTEIPYQLLEVIPTTYHSRIPPGKMPTGEPRQGVRLALDCVLPPGTQHSFILKPVTGPTRHPQAGAVGIARDTLQNEFLKIQALDNGTLCLCDRQTGQSYTGLLELEDTADVGDGWAYGAPPTDAGYLSTGGNVTFGLRENGPLLARLHLRVEWLVPVEFDFQHRRRSDRLASLIVEHLVTLRKGAQTVEIETTVHNTIRDHRLRLFCPTGLAMAESYWSDSPFASIERPIRLRADNHTLREMQVEMTPQQNWIALGGERHGLALLAPGQYESAVLDQPDRPLCLTLLRAFRKAVFTDGNEGGQIQGSHTIRLGLRPFLGTVPASELYRAAQTMAAPAQSVYLDAQDLRENTSLRRWNLVPKIDGNIVLSAQYRDRNDWVIRVFNPTLQPQSLTFNPGMTWRKDVPGQGSMASFAGNLGPAEVATFRTCLPADEQPVPVSRVACPAVGR